MKLPELKFRHVLYSIIFCIAFGVLLGTYPGTMMKVESGSSQLDRIEAKVDTLIELGKQWE